MLPLPGWLEIIACVAIVWLIFGDHRHTPYVGQHIAALQVHCGLSRPSPFVLALILSVAAVVGILMQHLLK
jgi:hypothetical protein